MHFPPFSKETEPAPSTNSYAALVEYVLSARTMLERVWDDRTAFQGITLQPDDVISRGQCGVSSVWLSRYLLGQGFNAVYTEGKIHIPNDKGDDHVWVEVHGVADEPLVVDLTSDQYQTPWGSPMHVGLYADSSEIIGNYTPEYYFNPYEIPRKKLLARYAILEENIARLPRRYQLRHAIKP